MTTDNIMVLEYEEEDQVKTVNLHEGDVLMAFPKSEKEAALLILDVLRQLYPSEENQDYLDNLKARILRGQCALQ